MPEARFPVEVAGGVPVVVAPEEVDVTNAAGLRAALLAAASDGRRRLVVDMTRTRFCDASGARALAAAHERAVEDGRQLLLAASGQAVLRVLRLTGVDQVIPRFASLEEALGQASSGDAPGSSTPGPLSAAARRLPPP